ncbi:MAG: hypothetical protein H6739_01925 [Alphaproteobacteria bacterium]|nr:hypothetical protein [Alphaproteobacteria bacterium]
MLSAALLFAAPAHADAALVASGDMAPCMGTFVSDTRPLPESADVPVDARLVALLEDGGCPTQATFTLQLIQVDEGQEVLLDEATGRVELDPITSLLALEPSAELTPGQDYIFRILPPEGFGELVEIGFTAGDGVVTGPPEAAPDMEEFGSSYLKLDDGTFRVTLNASAIPAEDPDGLDLIMLIDDSDGAVLDVAGASDIPFLRGERILDEAPDEVCVRAVQVDGAGREGPESEVMCGEPERIRNGPIARRCSTTGGFAGLFASLMGLMAATRRRRR